METVFIHDDALQAERSLSALGDLPEPAPVHLWNPPYCGEIAIRIARDGRWYHEGALIRRPALVQLFSRILRREADGSFSLVTPAERVSIRVEDCPFVAVLLESAEPGQLDFTLNTGERVRAGPAHPIEVQTRAAEPHPVLRVRPGLDALITRNVFYQMVAMAVLETGAPHAPESERLVLWSGGEKFVLGAV